MVYATTKKFQAVGEAKKRAHTRAQWLMHVHMYARTLYIPSVSKKEKENNDFKDIARVFFATSFTLHDVAAGLGDEQRATAHSRLLARR